MAFWKKVQTFTGEPKNATCPLHNRRILSKAWKISERGWWIVTTMALPVPAITWRLLSMSREEAESRPVRVCEVWRCVTCEVCEGCRMWGCEGGGCEGVWSVEVCDMWRCVKVCEVWRCVKGEAVRVRDVWGCAQSNWWESTLTARILWEHVENAHSNVN